MRFTTSAASALAAGALLFGVPAAASANTTDANPASANPAGATYSGFAQVADGQSLAQVAQEMGSAGTLKAGDLSNDDGFSTEELTWQSSSLLGLVSYGVEFHSAPGQPLTVEGKTAL